MKIIKYGHACVVLEDQSKKLVIDPGGFTPDFGEPDNIVAVVVTHVHPDHFNPEHLRAVFAKNPAAQLFTTQEVAAEFPKPATKIVVSGDEAVVGPFALHFTGEMHAVVHPDWQPVHNTGVRVGDKFYYGGDSFTPPDKPVELLAVPVGNAWLKLGEAMNFLASVRPKRCIRTHDASLSDSGKATADKWIDEMAKKHDINFVQLESGNSIEL